ncbi:coenzyme F420 hydrogenase subunit gamma (frhG) [Thermococcus cleftensis]|uniref:Coenzyme F420 hydrogenase subunit gamma (FrhG) n=1 Tax=Thermococcus cleftensis (strain DSM 27260 / KACC 17922 / CL1) TaxID=163003 RepID=I3ZUG9_THECF|nr:4Fe-4S binding protein [Thermococcus cleftensis]AFL95353.1 coenzyme F420 hydrogenase subunit gamma (frhG) [Thermococcus cleftensis]
MEKLKVLHVDIGGCEGCNVSIIRAYPKLMESVELDISYLRNGGYKYDEYDVALVTGGVCMNEPRVIEELKEVREKAKVVVAFGSCSALGGILRFCRGGQAPRPDHRNFQPINSVIEVDYSIPGCPPTPQMLQSFFKYFTAGNETRLRLFKVTAQVKKLSGFDLIDDIVLTGLCIGCGACELSCPTGAIKLIDKRPTLAQERCIRCGTCYIRCPRASQIICLGGVKS